MAAAADQALLPGIAFKQAAEDQARSPGSELGLPEKPPKLYQGKAISGDPVAFYEEVWGVYARANLLTRRSLRSLDGRLLKALDNAFEGRKDELAKLLPRMTEEATRRYEALMGRPVSDEERPRVARVVSFLKHAV